MWPPRCACSCGRWAGASSRPAYSSGLRTSTRPLLPIAWTTSSRKARMSRFGLLRGVAGRRPGHRLAAQLAGVQLPLLAAAVEQQHVLVAVELEVPVRVRREPVVVAAVEHDGVVVADAALGQQLLELLLVDEVAAHRVLQVLLPVELDRPGDVAAVVRGGVFVDLDQHDVVVAAVLFDPVGVDEYFLPAHVVLAPEFVGDPPGRMRDRGHPGMGWVRRRGRVAFDMKRRRRGSGLYIREARHKEERIRP